MWCMSGFTGICRLLCDCGDKGFKGGLLSAVSSCRQSGRAAEFETPGPGAGGRQRRPQINRSPPECGAESISGLLQATVGTRGIPTLFHRQPLRESHLFPSHMVEKVFHVSGYLVRSVFKDLLVDNLNLYLGLCLYPTLEILCVYLFNYIRKPTSCCIFTQRGLSTEEVFICSS